MPIISKALLWAAIVLLLFSCYEISLQRTDWIIWGMSIGFALVMSALSCVMFFLGALEERFLKLTQILSSSFKEIAILNKERHSLSIPGRITFVTSASKEEAALDAMTLDQLEEERKRAEKEERYERADLIRKKIAERKK